MPLDFSSEIETRSLRGAVAYQDGLAAEDIAAANYVARGFEIVAQRWRGDAAEVDIVARGADGLVFIEVKKARDHHTAAGRLDDRQISRICLAAEEYTYDVIGDPFMPIRIDAALVDGSGACEIIENISI